MNKSSEMWSIYTHYSDEDGAPRLLVRQRKAAATLLCCIIVVVVVQPRSHRIRQSRFCMLFYTFKRLNTLAPFALDHAVLHP